MPFPDSQAALASRAIVATFGKAGRSFSTFSIILRRRGGLMGRAGYIFRYRVCVRTRFGKAFGRGRIGLDNDGFLVVSLPFDLIGFDRADVEKPFHCAGESILAQTLGLGHFGKAGGRIVRPDIKSNFSSRRFCARPQTGHEFSILGADSNRLSKLGGVVFRKVFIAPKCPMKPAEADFTARWAVIQLWILDFSAVEIQLIIATCYPKSASDFVMPSNRTQPRFTRLVWVMNDNGCPTLGDREAG